MRTTIRHLQLFWLTSDLMDMSHGALLSGYRDLHHPLNEETKVYKKKTPSGWESTYLPYLSGWRDLNSRSHGPEPCAIARLLTQLNYVI
jgi:hypothetical protein